MRISKIFLDKSKTCRKKLATKSCNIEWDKRQTSFMGTIILAQSRMSPILAPTCSCKGQRGPGKEITRLYGWSRHFGQPTFHRTFPFTFYRGLNPAGEVDPPPIDYMVTEWRGERVQTRWVHAIDNATQRAEIDSTGIYRVSLDKRRTHHSAPHISSWSRSNLVSWTFLALFWSYFAKF